MSELQVRPPVAFTSIPAALSHWASQQPDTVAYTFVNGDLTVRRRVTYRELEQATRRIAAHLRHVTRPGDRVLLLLPPGFDYLTAFLGCLYAGVIAVPLYAPRPGAKLDRVAAVVHSCRPTLALTTDELATTVGEALRTAGGPPAHTVAATRTSGHPLFDRAGPDPADVAFLQYTSGSTGRPKGVMVSHHNLVANETAIIEGFGIGSDDVILSWLPMYHDMGLIGTGLLPVFYGIPAVLLDPFSFIHDPMIWPTAIGRFGATCSGGPNFAYQLLADRYDPARLTGVDLSSWRVAFNGAEPVDGHTLRAFAARYAAHGFDQEALFPCYGLAEATLFVCGSRPGAGYRSTRFQRGAVENGRLRSVGEDAANAVEVISSGRPTDGTTVLVRGDDGRSLPDGHVGEICVQGPGVAGGYWGEPAISEQTFHARIAGQAGTFLRTGDLGAVHDGHVYPVGRSKDLIIIGGRNFHPHDVESVASHLSPQLRPGGAAAFQPDPGERDVVLLLEVTRQAVAALRSDADAARRLAESVRREVGTRCDLQLSDVVFVFPGALPKTSSGKIRRAECRRRHLDGTLRTMRRHRPEGATDVPPPTERQQSQASLAGAVGRLAAAHLGYELTGQDLQQSLAALGMDSLKLVALKSSVEQLLGRPVEARLFYGDRSLAEIAEHLAVSDSPTEPARMASGTGPGTFPASDGQVQLAFHDELHPDDTANILPIAVRVARRLDPDRLRTAVTAAVARHPALRTVLGPLGTGTQIVRHSLPPDLQFRETDVEDLARARLFLEDVAFRRFALTTGPLVRVAAVVTPTSTLLLMTCHHVIVDYWSLRIVMAEILADVLGAEQEPGGGRTNRASAVDRADAQARTAHSASAKQELAVLAQRWRHLRNQQLFPSTPARRRRNPAGIVDFEIDAAATRDLYDHARSCAYTPFAGLAAAYLRALHRVTGRQQVVIGTPHHGRDDRRYADTVGYLVNMMPLVGDFRDGDALDDLARRTWRELHASLETAHIPLSRLIRELAPDRHGQHPLFQATLTFQQSADGRLDDGFALPSSGCRQTFAGVELQAIDLPPRDVAFAVSLYGARHRDRLVFRCQYQRELVGRRIAERVCEHFRSGLRELTAQP